MKKDIARVEFTLYGDEWPVEAFTEEIGIEPARCYKKGDAFKNGFSRFETVWSIQTGDMKLRYEADEDRKLFEMLIDQLRPHAGLINKYREKYQLNAAFFTHYSFYWAQTPGMRIESEVIAFAYEIGAYIDVYIDKVIDPDPLL